MRRAAEQLIRFCGRHRCGYRVLLAALGGLAALAVALRGHFTNDVSRLLPDTPEMTAVFRILHRAHLAETVQFEFLSAGDITEHLDFLEGAAARLAAMPGLRGVTFRYRSDAPVSEIAALGSLAPRFLPPSVLDEADPARAARNALKQLALPAPGQVELARNRPFGWENGLLAQLKALDEAVGFRLDPETPFFVTADRHRAMIAAESDVQLGDADAVRRLFAAAREAVGTLPPGVEMRIVSGCSHTLGNEEVLKRDAAIAGGVSLALFLLLFLWSYRGDGRALWIPLLPLYASLLALGAMTLLFREICLYVIGLGGCITGLAVDQGIHVYAAFRGEAGERRTAALAAPMALSAATSIAVFAALALTGIAAYIQLAVFAGLSLALSGFLALTLLPQLIDRGHRLRELLPGAPAAPRRRAWWLAALLLAGLAAFPGVLARADFALTSLDGTPESILREERDFDAAWRRPGPEMAALAAAGDDGEAALEHLERLTAELEKRHVAVAGPPRPSRREQAANRAAWRTPEAAQKRAALAQACRDACRSNGLPAAFFDPFFERLEAAVGADDFTLPPMLEHLDRRLVKEFPGSGAAIGLLPDTPENVRAVRTVLREHGGGAAALLSKEGFRQLIREELGGRFRLLLPLSAAAALLLLLAVFRRPSDVLLAMTPVVLAASGVVLVMRLAGFRATPAAAFALVLLIGLAADYGIYAVCQLRDPAALSVGDPILLSAATTVAGAGSLLFSHHPALFGTGVVLAPGIAIACWAGVWLVPRLKRVSIPKAAAMAVLAALALVQAGCAHSVPWDSYADAPALQERMALYPETPFGIQGVADVSFAGRDFRFLLAAEIDPAGAVRCAAVDPGSGALLFRSGDAAGEEPVFGPAFADGVPEPLRRFAAGLPGALRRIFVLKDDRPLAVEEKTEYIAVYAEEVTWRLLPGGALERRCGEYPCRAWRCEYRETGRDVRYLSYDENYVLSLKIGKWWRMEK